MASTSIVYPASHDVARDRVTRVIDLIAACPNITDEEVVATLVREGISEVDAELLVRFVPCGLSFAVLKLLGLRKFPSTYQVQNSAGKWVELPLAAEHYFSTALNIGHEVTTGGYTERISKEVFQLVTMRSAEMDAANKYFESGGTREKFGDGTFSPPTLIGLTAEQITECRRSANEYGKRWWQLWKWAAAEPGAAPDRGRHTGSP